MLIHGRLVLTSSGLMLDEVKSLLQKALRRKDVDMVTKATKELVGRGKDQLPWKSILTFLFEDHCLSDDSALVSLYKRYCKGDKFGCIETLLMSPTCRMAACLPVIALDPKFDPVMWDSEIEVDSDMEGLVAKQKGKINCDQLLSHLKRAWVNKDHDQLITFIKLATMVHDEEKRSPTRKGIQYMCPQFNYVRKPNFGHVVLSLMYKSTTEAKMLIWLNACLKLAAIRESPIRLILCVAVIQLLYLQNDEGRKMQDTTFHEKIIWEHVQQLDKMPFWAVDKHTYRGKFGRGTIHLVKKKRDIELTAQQLEEFHGERPKVGVKHFFDEGCKCEQESLKENPYWKRTQEIYLEKPAKLQKTTRMTAVYYKELVSKYKNILHQSPPKSEKTHQKSSDHESEDSGPDCVKYTTRSEKRKIIQLLENGSREPKHSKLHIEDKSCTHTQSISKQKHLQDKGGTKAHQVQHGSDLTQEISEGSQVQAEEASEENNDRNQSSEEKVIPSTSRESTGTFVPPDRPLLQLPTGSGKVYTRVDLDQGRVWKGPYRREARSRVIFFHRAMKDVMGDPHTFAIEVHNDYVSFPLFRGIEGEVKVTKRDFKDCIAKREIKQGKFVLRESLGVIQMHHVPLEMIKEVPMSFWAHYLFRFALNICDSGLYNAITDSRTMSSIYGIDMEENRKNVWKQDLLNYMFCKLPRRELCAEIMRCIKLQKDALLTIMQKEYSEECLQRLADDWNANFDNALFLRNIEKAVKAIKKL